MLRDRDRTEALGLSTVRPVLLTLNTAILTALRTGHPIREAVTLSMEAAERNLINIGVLGELFGRRRTQIASRDHLVRRFAAIDSVVSQMTRLVGLDDFEVDALRDKYRGRARAVIESMQASVLDEVSRTVEEGIRDGLHIGGIVGRVRQRMGVIGMTPDRPWLVENLVRTQTQIAYSAGRVLQAQSPAIDEILWGYEYVAVGDDRTRPNHMALDGISLPKDDPRWNEIMPPNGYNCRCSVIEIFVDDEPDERTVKAPPSGDVTVDGVPTRAAPDVGFEFNPADAVGLAPV